MIKFLEKCAQIEQLVSEIYYVFASNPENDETLANIWKDMARDEGDHCQQLRLAARLPASDAFNGVNKNCPAPEALHEQAELLLEKARSNNLSILEMLKTAVVLEKEFRTLHAGSGLEFKNASLRSTFEKLSRADAEHLRELDAYLTKYKAERQTGKP